MAGQRDSDHGLDAEADRERVRAWARSVRTETAQTMEASRALCARARAIRQRQPASVDVPVEASALASGSGLALTVIEDGASVADENDPLVQFIHLRSAQAELEEFMERLDLLRNATSQLKMISEVELIAVLRSLDGEGPDAL